MKTKISCNVLEGNTRYQLFRFKFIIVLIHTPEILLGLTAVKILTNTQSMPAEWME